MQTSRWTGTSLGPSLLRSRSWQNLRGIVWVMCRGDWAVTPPVYWCWSRVASLTTATMCAVPLQRSDNRRRGYATTATAARRLRDGWADGPVPRVLVSPFCPTRARLWERHVHSRCPVAQRDRSHPARETHPCGRADHRAWAPGCSRHSHNDPTSPTRCPEEPFLLDTFSNGVGEKFGTLSRARLSAARCPGRARSSAGAPSRRDRPPFVPLRSTSDGKKCDATIEA